MTDGVHDNDPRFVKYYLDASLTDRAFERAAGIKAAVLRMRAGLGDETRNLLVADIGCNAGTQSRCWLEAGHRVRGVDISRELVEAARSRNAVFGERAEFTVASALDLPWEDETFDVCLLPELLEHVDDWQKCLQEATRVLKPGGSLFLSTTNVLCPKQQEYALPLYSWYPKRLKQYWVRRALSDAPEVANFATYPAVHWFSPHQLASFLRSLGVMAYDRFDVMDSANRSVLTRVALAAIRKCPPLRFAGHVLTPSTIIFGRKLS